MNTLVAHLKLRTKQVNSTNTFVAHLKLRTKKDNNRNTRMAHLKLLVFIFCMRMLI